MSLDGGRVGGDGGYGGGAVDCGWWRWLEIVDMVDMGEGVGVVKGSIYFALFPNCGQFEGCRKLKRNEICSTKYMKPLIWNSNAIWIAGINSLYDISSHMDGSETWCISSFNTITKLTNRLLVISPFVQN